MAGIRMDRTGVGPRSALISMTTTMNTTKGAVETTAAGKGESARLRDVDT